MGVMLSHTPFFQLRLGTSRSDPHDAEADSTSLTAPRHWHSSKVNNTSQDPGGDATRQTLRESLSRATTRLMTDRFGMDVRSILREQEAVLPLLGTSRRWALQTLNRHFYSIRAAAEVLGQDNLATVAGRAEVLVSLLARDVVPYREAHAELLKDTWLLLDQIVERMLVHGDDHSCFSVARTAVCL
jgi:hypothetical protein